MSVRAMAAVWERSRSKGSDKLLLLAIADHADDGKIHGAVVVFSNAFPGNELLAEKCGDVDESTIRRQISRLKKLGELIVHANAGGTPEWRAKHPDRCPNLYEIVLPHEARKPTKGRHARGGAQRTPDPETANDSRVVPQVAGSTGAQPNGGGALCAPATSAERECSDARDGSAFVHERGCTDAPQTIQEPSPEPSTPPNPHSVGAGTRAAGDNPRATGTAPRDAGTNPRALDVDWFLEGARRDDTGPVPIETQLRRMRDSLTRGLGPELDHEGARP